MSLLILVIFIYAALAVNLFSGIMLQTHLSEKNNFQSFSRSMIMLFKFSTGGDWNDFMYELNNRDGFKGVTCQSAQTYQDIQINGIQGCGSIFAIPYLFSFIILLQMLIMNLSVAAVIEGLDTAKKENMGLVQGDDISDLLDLWQEYDPEGTGWITMIDLVFFLYQLPPPLGRRNFKLRMIDTPEDQ
jgi:voltage-dependent calcium channel L type alpha-1D